VQGIRRLSGGAFSVGEIKRLYVAPTVRGLGLGEALVRGIVDEGKQLEYTRLVLDTLPSMLEARSLYHALGFKPVAPYRYNPIPGTAFLELQLHDQGGVCHFAQELTARQRPAFIGILSVRCEVQQVD
jgi:ribosomal protein S18 acetylase RimI-like enzyme